MQQFFKVFLHSEHGWTAKYHRGNLTTAGENLIYLKVGPRMTTRVASKHILI